MNHAELLVVRIEQMGATSRQIVQSYMTWYTFYWVINLTALALVVGGDKQLPATGLATNPVRGAEVVVAWLFALMAGPATISSFFTLSSVSKRALATEKLYEQAAALVSLEANASKASDVTMWPRGLIRWGLGVNGTASVGLLILWIVIAMGGIGAGGVGTNQTSVRSDDANHGPSRIGCGYQCQMCPRRHLEINVRRSHSAVLRWDCCFAAKAR